MRTIVMLVCFFALASTVHARYANDDVRALQEELIPSVEVTAEEFQKAMNTTSIDLNQGRRSSFNFPSMNANNILWIPTAIGIAVALIVGYAVGRAHGKTTMMRIITSDQMRMDTDRMWKEALNRLGGEK